MAGDADEFGFASLHELAGKLRIAEETFRDHHWYLARSVAQGESPSCVEQIRWNNHLPDDAHELAGVTFAAHVRRQHIVGLGNCAGTRAANLGEQQFLHAVLLGEFSACLDGVPGFVTAGQQRGVPREQRDPARAVLQINQGGILRRVRPELPKIDRARNQNSRNGERFAKPVRNVVGVVVTQHLPNGSDLFCGIRRQQKKQNDGRKKTGSRWTAVANGRGFSPEHIECVSETAQRLPHGWNQLRHGTVPAFELVALTARRRHSSAARAL